MANWTEKIPVTEITEKVTTETVKYAERFGSYLGKDDVIETPDRGGRMRRTKYSKLTTNQLRKFFGEVKRQQMEGYDETSFVLLKPKLAYAVGRAKDKNAKINDFYFVIADAIDQVKDDKSFKRFIQIFEAIVAYHKAAEENN